MKQVLKTGEGIRLLADGYTSWNLLRHIPYGGLRESKDIVMAMEAIAPEIKLLYQRMETVRNSLYPKYSDTVGIEIQESFLGISPVAGESLDTRRGRIIARLNERLPYTLPKLCRMLAAIVGWGHFRIGLEGARLWISVEFEDDGQRLQIRDLLERIVPMNLWIDLKDLYQQEGAVHCGGYLKEGDTMHFYPFVDIENVQSDGKVLVAGPLRTGESMHFKPEDKTENAENAWLKDMA